MKKILCIIIGLLFLFSLSALSNTVDSIKTSPDTKVLVTFQPAKISAVADMDMIANQQEYNKQLVQLLDTFVTTFSQIGKVITQPQINSPPDYVIKESNIKQTFSIISIGIIVTWIVWSILMIKSADLKTFYSVSGIFILLLLITLFLGPYITSNAINPEYHTARDVLLFSG